MGRGVWVLGVPLSSACAPGLELAANPDSGDWPSWPGVDDAVLEIMSRREIAALSACAVDDGVLVWCQGYGFADVASESPAHTGTLFELASVSKLLTTAAALTAAESGALSLEEPVSLGLDVSWPSGAPTLRELLTHTGGLDDDLDLLLSTSLTSGEPDVSRFVPVALSSEATFTGCAPGERWSYSNTGMVVAALAVEQAVGQEFARYLDAAVLSPLELSVTATPSGEVALRYPSPRTWEAAAVEQSDAYPAGWLYADAPSLGRFLEAQVSGELGFDPALMLSPGTSADNFGVLPIRAQGLGAGRYREIDGRELWGHLGSSYGAHTLVLLDPEQGDGVVLLSTGIGKSGVKGWLALKPLAEVLFTEL